jgi:hypothetical protein
MKKRVLFRDCRLFLAIVGGLSFLVIVIVAIVVSVEIAGIILAIVLGIAGTFQDSIKSCIYRPELKVSFISQPPDAHKVALRDDKASFLHHRFYFRLKVENIGNCEMEDVEIVVVECSKENALGKYEKIFDFLPLNLSWSHYARRENPYAMRLIPAGFFRHCSFGYITKSQDAKLELYEKCEIGKNYKVVFNLDTVIKPYSGEHILSPGDYKIKIVITGKNLKSEEKTVRLYVEDEWNDDPKIIFSKNKLSIE